MTDEVLSILVDFNRMDDDDVIWAFRDRSSAPHEIAEGVGLRLYDGEGSECLGYVTRIEGDIVYVRPEWSTWRDAQPAREELIAGFDLMEALRASVAASRRRSLLEADEPLPQEAQETRPIPRREAEFAIAE